METETGLTADDARDFMRAINVAREATGLEPVEKITLAEYVEMDPGSPYSCLSATLLAKPLDGSVRTHMMELPWAHDQAVAGAWGTYSEAGSVRIHNDVLRMTDYFDAMDGGGEHATEADPVLAAFIDAGIIDKA